MSSSTKTASARRRTILEQCCEQLPNCTKALELAETGIRRPLKTTESIALKYHSRLCPFCGCAAGKFHSALQRMKEAETARRS